MDKDRVVTCRKVTKNLKACHNGFKTSGKPAAVVTCRKVTKNLKACHNILTDFT